MGGQKGKEGGQLGGWQREELRREHEQHVWGDATPSSPSPLGESQAILLKPCPNSVPVLQPSQLCVKQEPQRTVSFATGRDQDVWRHICWKQQPGTRIAGSSYDLRDTISAVSFTPCRQVLLQHSPVLGFPINTGYSYFVRSMFRKWDLS